MTRAYGGKSMLRQRETTADSSNERLVAVLEKVNAVLSERRARQTLLSELIGAQNEIEFLENKIVAAKNSLQKETPEVETLQGSLEKASLDLSCLIKEREAAEARYFRVKISEKDFRIKIAQLPKLNEDISRIGVRVGTMEKEFQTQNMRLEHVVSQKLKFQTEIDVLKQKVESLTAEIPLIKNTKDILFGLMPTDFDKDSYAALQGDFEKNLNNYTNDIGQEIDRITKRVADVKERIETEKSLQITLSAEKSELEKKYHSVLADTGGETDISAVMAALKQLEAKKINLIDESDRMVNVIDRVKLEINALGDKLRQEQSVNAESMQRRIYLVSIREEMKGIDDVGAQIRIQKEKRLNLDIEVGMLNRKIDLVSRVNQVLDTFIDRLQHTFEDHNTQWIEFVGSLNRMLF
jgi:predicted  nucleic acid-binding Zn-ribbon protein